MTDDPFNTAAYISNTSSYISQIGAMKPIFDALTALIALLLGAKAIREYRNGVKVREVDMRWRQAEMAKRLIDECWNDSLARAALTMIDWDGRTYVTATGTTEPISYAKWKKALRTEDDCYFSPDELFIRDAFDSLGNHMARAQRYIKIKLVERSDVEEWWHYYTNRLQQSQSRAAVEAFLHKYGFASALIFLAEVTTDFESETLADSGTRSSDRSASERG